MRFGFKITLFLLVSLLLTDCQDKNPCNLSAETLEELKVLDSIIKVPEIQKYDKAWMEDNYDEPSLFSAKTETYRLLWNSSFNGWKVIRIEEKDGHYKVTKKVSASHIDTVGVISEFELTKEVWDNVVNTLAIKNFWTYSTSKGGRVLDGASWKLEGYKPIKDKCSLKHYHCFGQLSSTNDTTFMSMCNLFLELKEN